MSSIERTEHNTDKLGNSLFNYNEEDSSETIAKMEVLIKALGTMVLFPDEISDPVNIGKKIYRGTKQMPILLDTQRELALNKLSMLIEQL